MKFELGKSYSHPSGKKMKIVGLANSDIYGICLVGEDSSGNFIPVGSTEKHAVNWNELDSAGNIIEEVVIDDELRLKDDGIDIDKILEEMDDTELEARSVVDPEELKEFLPKDDD